MPSRLVALGAVILAVNGRDGANFKRSRSWALSSDLPVRVGWPLRRVLFCGTAGRVIMPADQRVRGAKVSTWRKPGRLARTPQRRWPCVLFVHQLSCAFPDVP